MIVPASEIISGQGALSHATFENLTVSHRAAVYTVRVRKKRDTSGSFRLLGVIDEQGTSLLSALDSYFEDFEATSEDDTRIVRSIARASASASPTEVTSTMNRSSPRSIRKSGW